jgi:hypothetical protein
MPTIEQIYDTEHRTLKHRCGWLNCSECLCTYCILGGKKFHYHNMTIICNKHIPIEKLKSNQPIPPSVE